MEEGKVNVGSSRLADRNRVRMANLSGRVIKIIFPAVLHVECFRGRINHTMNIFGCRVDVIKYRPRVWDFDWDVARRKIVYWRRTRSYEAIVGGRLPRICRRASQIL